MNIKKEGYIKLKKVLKAVASTYCINKEDITVTASAYKENVSFTFFDVKAKKYSLKEEITLNLEDIREIILKKLTEDNIQASNIKPYFKHIEGDSFEPLDYGFYKLKGFNFDVL